MRFVLICLTVFGTAHLTVDAASAQATPSSGSTPVVIDCTVEPQTVASVNEIVAAAGTPFPATPDFDEEDVPYIKPDGTPASTQAIEGVTTTVEQFVACLNAGDFLRFLALVTDDYVSEIVVDLGEPLSENDPELTPSPVPEDEHIRVGEITDLIELPDGRVSALVTLVSTDEFDEPFPAVVIFEYDEGNGRWLIDEAQSVVLVDLTTIWNPVQGEEYEGVIVPPARAGELTTIYVNGPVQEFWLPTEDDVAELERGLPTYVVTIGTEALGVGSDFVDRLPGYKRQYAGFVQNGRRLILVNATCEGELDWPTEPVIVGGGGDCFFRVTYDPATGAFEDFDVNGEV